MASEILGLFNSQSPQQIRGAALDSMMISPAQMGSQGLLQQVVSMGQNAGTMLGMGAGSLLGGKVAGEVEASYIEEALKQAQAAGGTPAAKMKLVANFLADKPGMSGQAMKALTEARRLEAEDLTIEEAKFKRDNRRENVNVRVRKPVLDGLGRPIPGQFTEDDITLTRVFNPSTKKWEFIDAPPAGSQIIGKGTTMPDTGAGAGRGRVNPPLAAETQPVRETAPATTTAIPPVGKRPTVTVSPEDQAAIAEARRQALEQSQMAEEVARIRGQAPSSSASGGIQNAEPEAMPMPDEQMQSNFSRGEMEKKKQIAELSKLAQRYKKNGIDTSQIEATIAYLRKQLGNSWGNEVRN